MQQHLEEFKARGVEVLAISVDASEVSRQHAEKHGFAFTFLADPKAEVIRRYDLLHEKGGPTGDIARPAEFLIDAAGTVRWVNLTSDYRVRARAEDIVKVIDALKPAATPTPQ